MPTKDPVKLREKYLRKKRSGVFREQQRRHRERNKDMKLAAGCLLCGYNLHPAALELHHHRGRRYNDVRTLCANCHRIIHATLPVE